jgi:RNA-directed DNA polymerase
MIIVRYADDTIVGFEREDDARRFLDAMRERLREFALTLHPETRLIEFGRFAAGRCAQRGLGKASTSSAGDVHVPGLCLHLRQVAAGLLPHQAEVRRDRVRAKLRAVKQELHRRMHQPIPVQGK